MPTKKRLQYRRTSTGQRSALVDMDGGRFTCTYDSVKRLTQVINPQGQRTSYSYDNVGRRKLKKLANGSRTSYTYDAAGQMTTVAHLKSDATQQARFDYVYDDVGNRTNMVELDGSRVTWTYDVLDQLTGEHRTGTNGYRHTFTYDNRGNRTLKNLDGVRTTSTYDAANQLNWSQDAGGRTTYTFDADGNQQVVLAPSGARTTSVWDYENKLVGVLNPSGTRETMAYDPDGKRVKHQTASDTAKYVWDHENYLAETNASDVTQATYTNEPRTYGNLISQRKSGATHYYVFDALGSTRLLTDSSEAVAESLLYDAWGNLVTAAPTLAVPFRWVGELGYLFVPSTSDYYVRARVYRPAIGRWVSKDPLGLGDGTNRFHYVRNRSTTFIDPSGLVGSPPEDGWTADQVNYWRRECISDCHTDFLELGMWWVPVSDPRVQSCIAACNQVADRHVDAAADMTLSLHLSESCCEGESTCEAREACLAEVELIVEHMKRVRTRIDEGGGACIFKPGFVCTRCENAVRIPFPILTYFSYGETGKLGWGFPGLDHEWGLIKCDRTTETVATIDFWCGQMMRQRVYWLPGNTRLGPYVPNYGPPGFDWEDPECAFPYNPAECRS